MNNVMSIEEFIDSPDTVDFVIRVSQNFQQYIDKYPNVVFTQALTGGFVIAYANINNFEAIIRDVETSFLSSISTVLGTLDRPSLEAAGITQVQQQPFLDLTGRGVIIGIVDTGIDYTQDVFRFEDGTSKILSIFDQSFRGTPPEGFFVGTEYTNAQINEALNASNPYDIVPQQDVSGHGTFLASLAAGRAVGDYIGAAPEAELIVVKLKKARPYYLERYSVPVNQEDAFESTAVMAGVEYIISQARRLGRPVSICIGLGTNFGSHDGNSLLEFYLTGVSALKGVCISVAAGNEAQARHHMQGVIAAKGETANIDLRVGDQPGDVFMSILSGVSNRIAVSVRSPTGELVGRFAAIPNMIYDADLILERSSVRVEYYFPIEGSGGQITVVQIFNATPGIWTVILYGDIILEGTFNAWLPITGFIPPGIEFLAATPYRTVTIPGTMLGSLCCGAYDSSNNILYSASSWGPTNLPIMAPDLVAPGVNVGGFFPGGYGTMSGTSVAAAITAGAGALLMQWGIVEGNDVALSTYQIRAYLIRGCNRKEGISYPNPQWGYGSLNLLQTFQVMRGI
ncbi:MAG: S8 family peptidase [Eubacteriales bacterium]